MKRVAFLFTFTTFLLLFFSQGLTLESIYSDWLDTPGIPKVIKKSKNVTMHFVLFAQ